MIPLYESSKISDLTGVPEDMVMRVLRYLNLTEQQRASAQELAKQREDHDL